MDPWLPMEDLDHTAQSDQSSMGAHANLSLFVCSDSYIHVLLSYWVNVKAAPHECIIRTVSTLDIGKS